MEMPKAFSATSKIKKKVITGNRNIPDRVVSLFDTEARPIKKGKLRTSTEFGYKLFLQETEERVITGYELHLV